jgi:hypothetical protein
MSGQCTGWLLRHGPRPHDVDRDGERYGLARTRAMRAVLMPIADAANRDGENSHPGLDAIIEASIYSRRQVFRILDDAIAEGWVEVTEHPRRGSATVYRVVMGRRDAMAPQLDTDGVPSDPEWGAKSDPMGCQIDAEGPRSTHGDGTPDVPTVDTNGVQTPSTTLRVANATPITNLCNLLATSIELHRGGTNRPTVSKAWERDMRLLIERGPVGVDGAHGIGPDVIARAIAFVFEHLADPGRDKFCWADQVQSPNALRRHWPKLVDAKRKIEQGTGVSKGARTIDRVAERLASQQRPALELLPGGNTQTQGG